LTKNEDLMCSIHERREDNCIIHVARGDEVFSDLNHVSTWHQEILGRLHCTSIEKITTNPKDGAEWGHYQRLESRVHVHAGDGYGGCKSFSYSSRFGVVQPCYPYV